MKKAYLVVAFLLVVALPALLADHFMNSEHEKLQQENADMQLPASATLIKVKNGDTIKAMELETYLLGVLLGEVPASFEEEALKAQAVASRTYTLRKIQKQSKHLDADICTDSACCQAYMSEDIYITQRGTSQDIQKMKDVLMATSGQVLTYQGELIEATYFSSSGGMTEDAKEVWGASVPYLQSVSSPEEEGNPYYEKQTCYTMEWFLRCLGLPNDLLLSQEDMELTYTSGGGVDRLIIDGRSYSGTQLRALLNLPSTAMTLTVSGSSVIITTKGNGHRVGMSQYGADAMAVSGNDYRQILLHYYPGTQLTILHAEQIKGIFDKA